MTSSVAEVSAVQLNRATLSRQFLLERERLDVADAVRRLIAVQAQQPESVYVALASRLADFDPAELDAAFAQFTVVKGTLLRITLHAVHQEDHATLRTAALPTIRPVAFDRQFTPSGLRPEDVDAMVPALIEFAATPRTSQELQRWIAERFGGESPPGVWRALRVIAPLVHEPTGGGWAFGNRPSFRAATEIAGSADPERSAEAGKAVVQCYLSAFGPASIADIAQFVGMQRTRVKKAVQDLGDELITVRGPDGSVLHDVPEGRIPAPDVPVPPRLLPMWDNLLLAYADRSRVIPAEYRKIVTRVNGDCLPTLLVDGKVVGVWRVVDGKVEATPFEPLPSSAWRGLTEEAERLLELLGHREPALYRRYHHWWRRLPEEGRRILAG